MNYSQNMIRLAGFRPYRTLAVICASFFLSLSSIQLNGQGPRLILEEDYYRICEGEVALVEVTITGFPDVWYILEHDGESSSHTSNANTFRIRLTDPGMYVITEYGDDNTPGSDPPDTFYIDPFPAPSVFFTGGGLNCSEGDLDPLVVHFDGEPDFKFYFLFNGVADSLETRRTSITFPTDQSFTIEGVHLMDNNCQLDVDVSASYIYIDVPAPVIGGDTLVCDEETSIYRPAVQNYQVSWDLPHGGNHLAGSDDTGPYLRVEWTSPGIHPVYMRYTEDEYGCETEWGALLVEVDARPDVTDMDTSVCFELIDFLEINLEHENETVFWPELNQHGGQVYLYEVGRYAHVHTNPTGCSDTGQVRVTTNCEAQLYVPEAFTPNNGDNLNDELVLFGLFSLLDFNIYSPSGILLFHTTENPLIYWDGTYQGKDMPPGSYFWSAVFSQGDSDPVEASGVVTIIK